MKWTHLGIPLNDDDRKEWLAQLSTILSQKVAEGTGVVLACSALKLSYRNILRSLKDSHDKKVVDFVFLKGSKELLQERISKRVGHFMPSTLLQSQFETLEEPHDGEANTDAFPSGKVITMDISLNIDEIAKEAVAQLKSTKIVFTAN